MYETKFKRHMRHSHVNWPMIVFIGLMVFLLAGPVLHLMVFFFHMAFAALPFVIVLGMVVMISRQWRHGGSHGMRQRWSRHWDEPEKPIHGNGNGDGIFYI